MSFFDFRSLSGKVSIFGALVCVGIGGYFLSRGLTGTTGPLPGSFSLPSWSIPRVEGANFSLDYKKIPYDTKTIEVTFSEPIDPSSLTLSNVILSPAISGSLSVKHQKTLVFTPTAPLLVDETYSLALSGVTSTAGKPVSGQTFTFRTIPSVRATNIYPNGMLDNTNQNIIVTFSAPMIPLTNLDKKDILPCPLLISPKVEGRCHWLNGNTLELIPNMPLEGATRYQIAVTSHSGLLYPLTNTLTGEIMTPPLQVYTSDQFDPALGISIMTSTAVDVRELEQSLSLYASDIPLPSSITPPPSETPIPSDRIPPPIPLPGMIPPPLLGGAGTNPPPIVPEVVETGSRVQIPFRITPSLDHERKPSERHFIITLASGSFLYGDGYDITIKKGLKPKYGTEPLDREVPLGTRAYEYLQSIEPFQTIRDGSGFITDERSVSFNPIYMYRAPPSFLPLRDVFFRMEFMTGVVLDPALFSLRVASGETLPFDLSYLQIPDPENALRKIDDTRIVKLTPKSPLLPNTKYEVILQKGANRSLEKDVVHSYSTAPDMSLSIGKVVSNTEVCIYSNVWLNEEVGTGIMTTPKLPIRSFTFDEEQSWDPVENRQKITHRCEQQDGKVSYILGARLEPNKKYTLTFGSGFQNRYGDPITRDQSFSVTGIAITMKERFLYSSFSHFTQMIPTNLPIVMNFLSYNTDTAGVSVCVMNPEQYIQYSTRRSERCTKTYTKKLSLKNTFWNASSNKFDLAKDIMNAPLDATFYLVKANIDGYTQKEDEYESAKDFAHLFIRSNLVMTLEHGSGKSYLFASSLDGKNLPSDLTFEVYRRPRGDEDTVRVSPPVKWISSKKLYEIQDLNPDVTYIILAKNKDSFGVLDMNQDATSNYDFKYVAGQDSSERDYLYLYTDRPLYKVGETVFYKGLLRHFSPMGYVNSSEKKGTLKVLDEDMNVIYDTGVSLDANSNLHGSFSLPAEMPLGRYHFEFYTGEGERTSMIYTNGEFHVDAYKKPVFSVNTSASGVHRELGETGSIEISAEYYFGGKMSKAPYTHTLLSQSYYFDAKEYNDYQFGEGYAFFSCLYWNSCDYNDSLIMTRSGTLDSLGEGRVEYSYAHNTSGSTNNGERIYSYTFEVRDPDTQKTVSDSVSQVVHTTDAYVGIRVPYWGAKPESITVDGVVLDYDAKPLSGRNVVIELWKKEYKEVRKQGVDGFFYNESEVEMKKESEKRVMSDQRGEFTLNLKSATGGSYEVRALYTGENSETFTSSSEIYVDSEGDTSWNEGNNSVTDLIADATIVKVGDTARFTLKSPVSSGKMFISIEKDDGVLDSYVRDIQTTTERIEFPVTESSIPNVYVKVFLIGQQPGDKLPTYKRALGVVKVVTDPKKLDVSITPEKSQYLPGQGVKLSIAVKDSGGRGVAGANGSIAVVDESLLALMGNPLKNPFAFFYDMKRYLGVMTYTSLVNLIEKLEVKDLSDGSKGGAGEGQKGGLAQKKRGTFKDTAFWLANYTTDSEGKAVITTDKLPDNLTTWVIESIVSTSSGNKVGIASAKVRTTKAVIINENLPRFLGSSDRVTLSPVIFNKTGKAQKFQISLSGTNVTIDTITKTIFLGTGASLSVAFPVQVAPRRTDPENPFATRLTIRAVAEESGDRDEVENTLPILVTSTPEMVATVGKTATTAEEQIALDSKLREYGGALTIHYGATLLPNLLSGIRFLEEFAYGCAEQRTSALMPSILLQKLYNRLEVPHDLTKQMVKVYMSASEGYREKSIDSLIREYLVDIRSFQQVDGGFAFWQERSDSDPYLTARLLSAFAEMRSLGYIVDAGATRNAITYLKKQFYENRRPYCLTLVCPYSPSERLMMIEAIMDTNPDDYEAYKMYKVVSLSGELDTVDAIASARVQVRLCTLRDVTDTEKAELRLKAEKTLTSLLSNSLVMTPRGAYVRSGDRVETTARLLELATLLGKEGEHTDALAQMERWLIAQKGNDGSFGSTASTATLLRALFGFIEVPTDMQASLKLDTNILEMKNIMGSGRLQSFTQILPLTKLQDRSLLRFEKTGSGNLYYDMMLEYQIPAEGVMSRDEGFLVANQYYDYEDYRRIERLKQEEWEKYMSGLIDEKNLQYSKEITEYLTPLDTLEVGKLVYVTNQIITGEYREEVAFEGFIPSGTELINPNFATENPNLKGDIENTPKKDPYSYDINLFDHTEWRDDRYFATARYLSAGVHTFSFLLRPTHAGTYHIRPSRAFEFYTPEVFGRSRGKMITIVQK